MSRRQERLIDEVLLSSIGCGPHLLDVVPVVSWCFLSLFWWLDVVPVFFLVSARGCICAAVVYSDRHGTE